MKWLADLRIDPGIAISNRIRQDKVTKVCFSGRRSVVPHVLHVAELHCTRSTCVKRVRAIALASRLKNEPLRSHITSS